MFTRARQMSTSADSVFANGFYKTLNGRTATLYFGFCPIRFILADRGVAFLILLRRIRNTTYNWESPRTSTDHNI